MKASTENKIISFISALIGISLVIAFCAAFVFGINALCRSLYSDTPQTHSAAEQLSGKVYVFTDPDTGVQYLMYTVNGGITPRLDCTGKPIVSPVGVIYDEKN